MASPLKSLIACGTKLWLDSVDPDLIRVNHELGASGATSNPAIIGELLKSGRFDAQMARSVKEGLDDSAIAWHMTDTLVREAQSVFQPIWQETKGNNGYVSFELDPLLEDPERGLSQAERTARYIALGKEWSQGHENRMIKVPATPGGIGALEELCAAGVTLNVTLIFSPRQYRAAREAIWRGAQRRKSLEHFKSVYSIFVSRVDQYTEKHAAGLSAAAQGQVGIVNAKRIWKENRDFWASKQLPLQQEMIFASTGTKNPNDPPWKYVAAFAGSDIETNPPATNEAVEKSSVTFTRQVDQLPPPAVLDEIDRTIKMEHLEETLMSEGIKKFADPQKGLLALIGKLRSGYAT
ncbi:MAG TPA: transaldolase family protein [Pirellulales bacterium]|jgi:transaldolase|nr:transaldolase family protein [Pirellulales bacterium]